MAETQEPVGFIAFLLTPTVLPFFILSVIYAAITLLDRTDVPKIKGLPEIPGWPIFGNLIELGDNHALTAAKWAKRYGPVFQVRMGNRRIVFANTFDSVKNLWITNQSALISSKQRPLRCGSNENNGVARAYATHLPHRREQ